MTKCWCVWCRQVVPALSTTQEGVMIPQGESLIPTGCCFHCHEILAQMHWLAYSRNTMGKHTAPEKDAAFTHGQENS